MRKITDEELEAAIDDALIVQQVTIVEMLFLLSLAAIIALAGVLYYPEANRRHISHGTHEPAISQPHSSDNQA